MTAQYTVNEASEKQSGCEYNLDTANHCNTGIIAGVTETPHNCLLPVDDNLQEEKQHEGSWHG